MLPPIFVRSLTEEEHSELQKGLRSPNAFVLRRCQILLCSERQERVPVIAQHLNCDEQTVRNVIHGFNTQGLKILERGSHAPKNPHRGLSEEALETLKDILHRSPRDFQKNTSLWTLDLITEVCFEKGVTSKLFSRQVVVTALSRLNVNWNRAKHWITSPDPEYVRKKTPEIA